MVLGVRFAAPMVLLGGVLLLAAMSGVVLAQPVDRYAALGLRRDASEKEIKQAFKKLARELHPDAANSKEDRELRRVRFIAVSEAYEILSDPVRRKQYDDSNGQRTVSTSEDRNFLRHNLFSEGFAGQLAQEPQMTEMLQKGLKGTGSIVFLWSANFPECIDAAPAFKKLSYKLSSTSMTPLHFRCDDGPHICRQLTDSVPAILLFQGRNRFRYTGTYEVQALTDFVTKRLKLQIRKLAPQLFASCPVVKIPFAELLFTTVIYENDRGVVALEYSPCYDCDSELLLAMDSIRKSFPGILVSKVDCRTPGFGKYCSRWKDKNRAWTIVELKDTYSFSMVNRGRLITATSEPRTTERRFAGRFHTVELVHFLVASQASPSVMLTPHRLTNVKRSNDSFAILIHDGPDDSPEVIQWNLLAGFLNRVSPYKSKKGKLRILTAHCKHVAKVCDELIGASGQSRPIAALFPFGMNGKKRPPVWIPVSGTGWVALRDRIKKEAEPLHLHILTPTNYDKKVSKALASKKNEKRWLIMYNAGNWCPPCNQMRAIWPDVARAIQEHPTAKKTINVGLVECDTHRSLCNQLGLEGYPSTHFLGKGRPKAEFGGNRDARSVVEWAIDQVDSRTIQMHPQELMGRIQSGQTLLVSYTAGAWCPPCTAIAPAFKQASNLIGDIPATVINCDDMGHVCQSQGIEGFPTVMLYVKGRAIPFQSREKRAELIVQFVKDHTS